MSRIVAVNASPRTTWNTLQVKDYSRFDWTMFNSQMKQERHDKVFPEERKKAFQLGAEMITKSW